MREAERGAGRCSGKAKVENRETHEEPVAEGATEKGETPEDKGTAWEKQVARGRDLRRDEYRARPARTGTAPRPSLSN